MGDTEIKAHLQAVPTIILDVLNLHPTAQKGKHTETYIVAITGTYTLIQPCFVESGKRTEVDSSDASM